MTEGIMTQKVTPLLKCLVLFLFIFTAKVLTSRPNESHETRNGIHHVKPSYYVRTFTKYHHRRTIQWNNQDKENYWPLTQQEHPKVIGKRSLDSEQEWPADVLYSNSDIKDVLPWPLSRAKRSIEFDSKEIIESGVDLKQISSDSVRENLANFESNAIGSGKDKLGSKNGLPNNIQEFKVKAAIVVTDPPTTSGPSISCLYKIHSVSRSVTPSYIEDEKDQVVVESQSFDTGPITETVLPTGPVQIEKCTDPRASCYTLWHQDKEGNITVLGQGCWKSSGPHRDGDSPCDKCTLVTARLPQTKFCCCTKSYCNADFTSIKEEIVTIKAESTMEATPSPNPYSNLVASSILALAAIAVMVAILHKFYCNKQPDTEIENQVNLHKGEVMGSGPDALATGLLCVDNLTLIEHIGQGKFGSVWSGTLGSTPVAVKLFSSPNAWQKEAAIYGLPHLSHPNILRYYGSDTRPTLTEGSREYLIVLELCTSTLRTRLQNAPLSWIEFATLAHGLSSALAHLHTPSGNKPCIVHRDVNSLNVLVTGDTCRLADFGLAHTLHHAHPPNRLTEAGTLRYLCPEALEGALDLSVCGAALQAVDVFALALVLWEMLWRTAPAHRARTPPYALPYHHHGVGAHPTLQQMQTLVSRNKARPPLPKGPVPEWRALKIATDTCDECWDHDAEARLTALCVEERMNELKQLVCAQPPNIHDNKIQNLPPGDFHPSPEMDKNSNCTVAQTYDVTTPLLYPYPHIGRNACIERNTHTSQQNTVQLIHKSLKDITAPENRQVEENCLSMARTNRIPVIENSIPEIRSYQRPLEYIPNDVTSTDSDRGLKETNLLQEVKVEKPKWGIRKFFEKFNKKMETEVKLVPENSQRTKTSIVNDKPINIGFDRPANLVLNQENLFFEAPCLSPPNKTLSPTMMEERVFKEMPDTDPKTPNQIFAVIVPKAKPNLLEMRNRKGSSESINKSVRTSMSSQSMFKSNSESEDSTVKKRLSCDNKIISNSASSSRASINLELQYIDNTENYNQTSPYDLNSDCSSSEDEHLMLLSENGGSKITMQTITKPDKDVLKEATQPKTDFTFNKYQNKYSNFDNEYSDPNDKENLVNGFSGDNPVYIAALNGEIDANDIKIHPEEAPKPCLKTLTIKRQHSLEQVSELFSSAGDVNLLNPAGRVKTPGDLPVAVRRARRDRALQKGRASECNRLSLYDDRMMFGNSL